MNPDVSIVGYGVRLRAAAGAELGRAPTNDDSLEGAHEWLFAATNEIAASIRLTDG